MRYLYSFGCLCLALLLGGLAARAEGGFGQMADIEIGGPGTGPGQLHGVQDIAFDAANRLYVLEGRYSEKNVMQPGNCRVQIFDNNGKYQQQFSLAELNLGDKCDPTRFALDSRGDVFITFPTAGLVAQYHCAPPGAQDGKGPGQWHLAHTYQLPGATAITTWTDNGKERIAVLPSALVRNKWVETDQLSLLDPVAMAPVDPLKLSKPVSGVMSLKADAHGNLFVLANVNQLYKFDAHGTLLDTLGSGTYTRKGDGSELRETIALDAQGNIYSLAWGRVARFDAELKTVALLNGEFYWYDNWSPAGTYNVYAFDRNGRFWVGVGGEHVGDRWHYRPCVTRAKTNFFAKMQPTSITTLGLDAGVQVKAPYNVVYDLAPVPMEFVVKPATRRVHEIAVSYHIYDAEKHEAGAGQFTLPLTDGQEARHPLDFTPPRWGWYTVECQMAEPHGGELMAVGAHVGVTPKFPGMPVLADGDSPGGWVDPARQGFCGLRLMRINTGQMKEIEKTLDQVDKYGLTVLVQFQDKKDCTPEIARDIVTRCKGRVKYYEFINEPNFSVSPVTYADLVKQLTPIIKQIDPAAQVMGPTVCGINLGWNEAVFKEHPPLDIIAIHDYEGNESIDPGHWRWKIGQLRALMAQYGYADKPIWQTERAIGAVRGQTFNGMVQAVRVTLQRDVLETLGIPNEHDLHYYINQGGYSQVPTYIWSSSGPHPAALALRTREAMVLGRKYAGTLDFGPTGNKLFLALRYTGADGATIVLRQYGNAVPLPVTLGVTGAALEVVDSFGNSRTLPVANGAVTLPVPALPLYLRLAQGQQVTAPVLDYGRNYAPEATFAYSGKAKGDVATLTNGLFEVTHAGNPWGPFWQGELKTAPQTLDLTFPMARTVNRVVLYSVRADNPYCDLLDFDVQYDNGGKWVTLKEVRTPCPPSDPVRTAESGATTWYQDQNFALVEFPPVTTTKLRIVALRSTLGFQPDAIAAQATGWQAGAPTLALREVEVYGPPAEIALSAHLQDASLTQAFVMAPISVSVHNGSAKPLSAIVKLLPPDGWHSTADLPLTAPAGQSAAGGLQLVPPRDVPTGTRQCRVLLTDAQGKVLDSLPLSLTVVSPVALAAQPVTVNAEHQPTFAVKVTNTSDHPVSGVVRIGVKDIMPPVDTPLDTLAPGAATVVTLPATRLTRDDASWTVSYDVVIDRLVTHAEQLISGWHEWQVVGPFPFEFATAFAPEQLNYASSKVFDAAVALPDGKMVKWQKTAGDNNGFVNLIPCFTPHDNVSAYGVIYAWSPTARRALASAGSDDGMKGWVNGKVVIEDDSSHGASPGQVQAPVDLKAGWNILMVKITQGGGGWGFYFDLLTPDGQAMSDIRYAATNTAPPAERK